MAKDDGMRAGSRAEYVEPLIPQDAPGAGRVILRDGRTALLRSVDGMDDRLRAFVRRETGDVRLQRLFGVEDGADGSGARTLLGVFQGDRDEHGLIAVGGWFQSDLSKPSAEVGFLVRKDKRGLGLGTILLEQLALMALRRGLDFFTATVDPDNCEMLQVFQDSGFEIKTEEKGAPLRLGFAIRPNRRSVEGAERRERIATVASLRPFFQPKSVAVIGASRNPDAIGRRIFEYLLMNRFEGPVYPVNPSARVVGSVPAYPSVSALPEKVDLAVIAVPRDAVIPTVEECGRAGVRAVVVITAGFAETGAEGRAMQAQLIETARGYGMRVVGPNCLGLLNADPKIRLNASFSPIFPPYGPVSMSSQSGALGIAILQYAAEMGLGMSNFVSVGNKADVSGNDLLEYWEEDPNTGLILLYLESFGNPRRFSRIARRVGRKKPVLVVKSGRTEVGHRAAGSHTAALAANETMVDALFEQAGVIRADTLEEMFDIAALLAYQPLPAGKRIAVVTNAGGPGILAADVLAGMGLSLPETSPELQKRLGEVLPATASRRNPIDMIASATADQYRRVLEEILASPEYDAVIVIFLPVGLTATEEVAQNITDALGTMRDRGILKPVATVLMGQSVPAALRVGDMLIPNYRFPEGAARALARAYRYAVWRATPEGIIPDFDDLDVDRARALIKEQLAAGASWLDPGTIADLFTCFGLPWAGGRVAATPEEAAALAREIGFPVVVKMVSRTLLHKSEWGGVVLGLTDGEAVRAACQGIRKRLAQAGRENELDGFLVQPMIQGGVELMVGVTTDPQFGPLIAFGLGGIYVEVLRDVVFRVTPLTDRGAREMVRGIRGYRLLEGYRGHAAADIPAVEDLLLRLSRMVEELPEVVELDLNPVMALEPGRGCRIVDARVRVARASR
ncbi:bifunctional acetate--CoA ligase family protein/GNAT family N-acetyltransferase [Kyrpidia spormannii]|uniref:CoA-binding domain protein n=2 Tax=Kyrpidia spormannii TaxID=2055160 RepID=A0ACA8ZA28_9BACL|nr:bifunctional GNAT family N-acetyltransferase/acetate--CoA ligase family protein [Kyrpidia spormannii]CAB3393165.1 CoA-binding domain protein [Kyrpidia spormannii]CAB3394084.1 CoA-binding domain protein [Kyrpidia spormannii]